jgi:guanine deaminase
MYYCSPDRVTFLTRREDYAAFYQDERKYISFSSFYGEFGKPWTERRLPMIHQAHPDGIVVYQRWKELNA